MVNFSTLRSRSCDSPRARQPYEIEAAQAQADFKVAQSQYVESGAKTAWDAAHKSADPKAKAGAAAKPGAVPATPLPAGTGELHHLLHQFHTEEGLDKLDDIRAAIAALSEPLKRAVAEESLAGIIQVKADRLKVKEAQLMKT